MSTVTIHRIRCDAQLDDGCTCMAEADHPLGTTTFAEVRAWLKEQGWHQVRGGRDICPDCWKEGRR